MTNVCRTTGRRAVRAVVLAVTLTVATLAAGTVVPVPAAEAALTPAITIRTPVALPPTLVALDGPTQRMAIFSPATGKVVRYLTTRQPFVDEGLPSFSADRKTVYFIRDSRPGAAPETRASGTFTVPVGGGRLTWFKRGGEAGSQPFAVGPKGAYAGSFAGVATVEILATNAQRHVAGLVGTRDYPADSVAWAPDGVHLAVATITTRLQPARLFVVDTRTAKSIFGRKVGCPAALAKCVLRGAGFGRDGSLYTVAVVGSRSSLVRLAPGARLPVVVTSLPGTAQTYRVFVAPTGAVLVSAETWTPTTTASTFVVAWDGVRLRSLPRRIMEPAW